MSITAYSTNNWRYSTNHFQLKISSRSEISTQGPLTLQVWYFWTFVLSFCSLTLRLARVKYWGNSTQQVKIFVKLQIRWPSRRPEMQTVERASLFITRWLARHPFSEAVKFDDDEIQKAVIVLEELNHWLPINFRYTGGSANPNFLRNQWNWASSKMVVILCAWLMMGQNPETSLKLRCT